MCCMATRPMSHPDQKKSIDHFVMLLYNYNDVRKGLICTMAKGDKGAKLTEGGAYQSRADASIRYNQKKKRIMVRMNEEAGKRLDQYAADHNVSLNELILQSLEEKTGMDLR